MALRSKQEQPAGQAAAGRRVVFGTNVAVVILLAIGIVVVLQLIAYSAPARWDMTSSGINSLSDGTESLLRGLDAKVNLTSLYFETDREDEDQPRYRQAIMDLLGLYEATNRGKVTSQWINPLKDHERLKKLLAGLYEKNTFKNEIETYQERIEAYIAESDGLDTKMNDLVQSELDQIAGLGSSTGAAQDQGLIAQVEMALRRWAEELESTRKAVDQHTLRDDPQYVAAVNELKGVYRSFTDTLNSIVRYGANEAATKGASLSSEAGDYLGKAEERYAALIEAIEAENEKLQELKPVKIDDLLRQLGPTTNAVLVETEEDALVVDFSSIWPPLDPRMAGRRVSFRDRAFKGEEKVTAAILRATHKEQTAVVFVRYGGHPLVMGGFMPGMPAPAYANMKEHLEDANFIVEDWDLKASITPPEIDPKPTRTVYIVLKPTPPPRGQMGQPSQEPPFAESHKRAFLDALGDSGRALFIAGWHPGPYGPIPSTYEYNDYLDQTWGIKVDTSALLIHVDPGKEPGKFLPRQDSPIIREIEMREHPILSGPQWSMAFPMCAPLELSDSPPEGAELTPLLVHPRREVVWGARNLGEYDRQLKEQRYLTRVEGDLEGPFTLAVAATKGDAKVVLVSSAGFAEDSIALARQLELAAEGFRLRSRNPGNATLFVNSLHWLNDNMQFMNIGRPIDLATLEVEKPSTVRVVQTFTIVVWPILALVCGGAAWWVRRR